MAELVGEELAELPAVSEERPRDPDAEGNDDNFGAEIKLEENPAEQTQVKFEAAGEPEKQFELSLDKPGKPAKEEKENKPEKQAKFSAQGKSVSQSEDIAKYKWGNKWSRPLGRK